MYIYTNRYYVYALFTMYICTGARASFIRGLMIGHVANITGEFLPPKYTTLFLQVYTHRLI